MIMKEKEVKGNGSSLEVSFGEVTCLRGKQEIKKDLISKMGDTSHCCLGDAVEGINQNIIDLKQIIGSVAKSLSCSKTEAFQQVWPYYRKAFGEYLSSGDLTPQDKKKIKGIAYNFLKKDFSGK